VNDEVASIAVLHFCVVLMRSLHRPVGALTSASRAPASRKIRSAPSEPGLDEGAVQYLVLEGFRPADRAASILLAAQQASGREKLGFTGVRDVLRELRNLGCRKQKLLSAVGDCPAVLSLSADTLRQRLSLLRSILQAGEDDLPTPPRLPRLVEKHCAVLTASTEAVTHVQSQLRLLLPTASAGDGCGDLLFAVPQLLSEPRDAWTARLAQLRALLPLLSQAQLEAAVAAHPPLLCPPPGTSLPQSVAFWRGELGGDCADPEALEQLLAAFLTSAPSAFTAALSVLRRKRAFFREELGASAADVVRLCPASFGAVSLDRTLAPRCAWLCDVLGVSRAAALEHLARWADGCGVEEFCERCAQHIAPTATVELAAFRAFCESDAS